MSPHPRRESLEERIGRQERHARSASRGHAIPAPPAESSRARQKKPQESLTSARPSELERLALPDGAHPSLPFVYDDGESHSHDDLTVPADKKDYDRKVARLQHQPHVMVQATPDSYQLMADEPELREFFADNLGEIIPQMSLLIVHCRAKEQQKHMYREIAVKLSRENRELRRVIEQDQGTYQATLDETEEAHEQQVARLRGEISRLKSAAATPAPVRAQAPALRAPVLPFTPATRRTAADDSTHGYAVGNAQTPSRFLPATPLMTSAVGRQGTKATVKFPDPPLLKDGREIKFEQWRDQLEDKLRANTDHYIGATHQDTQQNMVAYMRTRTEGKAYESLSTLIRTLRGNNEEFDYTYLLDRLEKNYGNPHKRVEARAAFRRLRLYEASEFADYQGDFFQLAQEQGLPADQWVEEFHEKLTPTLRAAMAPHVRTADYDTYVDLARDIAREHAAAHRVERKRSGKLNAPTPTGRRAPTPAGHRSVTPNPSTPATTPRRGRSSAPAATTPQATRPARGPDDGVTCFNCHKSGHYSRDCPSPRAEHKLVEEDCHSDSDSEPESSESSESETGKV